MELLAQGHAGYDVAGHDIVCAGVSALLYGFKSYLEEQQMRASGKVFSAEWDGGLKLRTQGFGGADTQGWEVIRAGIDQIAKHYPQYVNWEEIST